MVSEVVGYTNMTQDICDIEKAVAAGNNTVALDIYLNGKNSMGGSSLRKFMTWATAVHPNETYYEILAAYYGVNFTQTLNTTIVNAFQQGQGSLGAALITITAQVKYMMHEVDAALRGVTNDNTNATSGPAHNLDETWAIFSGAHPDSCTTLLKATEKAGQDLGVTHAGRASAAWAVPALMHDLQYCALTGNSTLALYRSSAAALREEVAIMLAQVVLGSSYSAELAAKCNVTGGGAAMKNTAFAAWWPLAAQLSAWNATKASLAAVNTALTAQTLSYTAVKTALLKSAVLGQVEVRDVGLPVRARLLPSGCKAVLAP